MGPKPDNLIRPDPPDIHRINLDVENQIHLASFAVTSKSVSRRCCSGGMDVGFQTPQRGGERRDEVKPFQENKNKKYLLYRPIFNHLLSIIHTIQHSHSVKVSTYGENYWLLYDLRRGEYRFNIGAFPFLKKAGQFKTSKAGQNL